MQNEGRQKEGSVHTNEEREKAIENARQQYFEALKENEKAETILMAPYLEKYKKAKERAYQEADRARSARNQRIDDGGAGAVVWQQVFDKVMEQAKAEFSEAEKKLTGKFDEKLDKTYKAYRRLVGTYEDGTPFREDE